MILETKDEQGVCVLKLLSPLLIHQEELSFICSLAHLFLFIIFLKSNNSATCIFEFSVSRVGLLVFLIPKTMRCPLFAYYGMLLLGFRQPLGEVHFNI